MGENAIEVIYATLTSSRAGTAAAVMPATNIAIVTREKRILKIDWFETGKRMW